ncbi:GAF domain-containing protein [Geobacter sp.]|uniref:GAF domain-containing protein n=1 Tax=Geobacter sp. TaxID=46610 RepID=UPI00260F1D73|nr:GAF domain-containing protein [Geobacter sp.]
MRTSSHKARRLRQMAEQLDAANGELSRSEQRYRDLFTGMPSAFALGEVVCDGDGAPSDLRYLEVNRTYERLVGLGREELVGRRITEARPDIDPYLIERFGSVALSGEPLHLERFSRELGLHLDLYAYSPFPGQFALVFNDITARKANEKRRHLESLRLRALLQLSDMLAEPEEKLFDFALQTALDLTGSHYGYLYLYGGESEQFTRHAWSSEVMAVCAVTERKGSLPLKNSGLCGEVIHRRGPVILNDLDAPHPGRCGFPDGHIRLDRFMSVPFFEGERIVCVVAVANKALPYDDHDVQHLNHFMHGVWQFVARKRAEEEQARLRDQLLHAQKMDLIGQMAGGVSHDFNNILAGIAGYASIARQADPQVVEEALERIAHLTGRGTRLTASLLAFSRERPRELVEMDLTDVVAEVSQIVSRLAGSDIVLNTAVNAPLPVLGDRGQLEQVLLNLTTNACQAMPGGGLLTITCGVETLGRREAIRHREARPGRFAVVRVIDSGVGIAPEHIERIFEPFFTTKEVGQGAGLGLSVVYGIVRDHNGFVLAESVPGSGTVFSLHLPTLDRRRGNPAISPQRHTGTERILVADPDPLVRQVVRYTLMEFGYRVSESPRWEEGMRSGGEEEGFDLMLVDATLLRDGGSWSREGACGHRLIILGEAPAELPSPLRSDSAVARVAKPVRPAEILTKVREVLDL